MAYVRKYKTGSGATGVQICYKEYGRVVRVIQVGSARSEEGIAKLVKQAKRMIYAKQGELFPVEKYEVGGGA